MNSEIEKKVSDINIDIKEILDIILVPGRTEAEAVLIAHVITKEVDRFFDSLGKVYETNAN